MPAIFPLDLPPPATIAPRPAGAGAGNVFASKSSAGVGGLDPADGSAASGGAPGEDATPASAAQNVQPFDVALAAARAGRGGGKASDKTSAPDAPAGPSTRTTGQAKRKTKDASSADADPSDGTPGPETDPAAQATEASTAAWADGTAQAAKSAGSAPAPKEKPAADTVVAATTTLVPAPVLATTVPVVAGKAPVRGASGTPAPSSGTDSAPPASPTPSAPTGTDAPVTPTAPKPLIPFQQTVLRVTPHQLHKTEVADAAGNAGAQAASEAAPVSGGGAVTVAKPVLAKTDVGTADGAPVDADTRSSKNVKSSTNTGENSASDASDAVASDAPAVPGVAAAPAGVNTDEAVRAVASFFTKPADVDSKAAIPSTITPVIAGKTETGASAVPAPAAQDSPAAATPETFDQIVLGLQSKMDARTGKAEIHLEPPNLGAVKVSVSLANGVLTADFQSSTGAVRDLLKSHLDKLKTVLESQGVAVDRLSVGAPPADSQTAGGQGQSGSFGSATHDGRSAGGFQQDARPGQQRWQDANAASFAQTFRQVQDAPIDLVA